MSQRARTKSAIQWETRRRELLGWERCRRPQVAAALGVSLRTMERWEVEGPPGWYDAALVGLAVKLGTLHDVAGELVA